MSREPHEEASIARKRAMEVFAISRAHNARFYKEFYSVNLASPTGDGVGDGEMPVTTQSLGQRGGVAPGAIATLADVTLGSSIRRTGEVKRRTATVGLTIQFLRDVSTGMLRSRAEALAVMEGMGVSQGTMHDDDGNLVAIMTGTFALRSVPKIRAWLPYAQDLVIAASSLPPVDPNDLNDEERELLGRAEASVSGGEPDGPYATYLGIDWRTRGSGTADGVWPLGPHIWNRAACVHGGAMFGALSEAALACFPSGAGPRVVEQHVQFLRPGQGPELKLEARVTRRGKLLSSVTVSASNESGKAIASSIVTLENQLAD